MVNSSSPIVLLIDKAPVPSPDYKCSHCRATNCKLWRPYNSFVIKLALTCAHCSAIEQNKDISDIDEKGSYTSDMNHRIYTIGYRVPAIPTEIPDTYYGYTSIPAAAWSWWQQLPTFNK
jgi:hypothetical protein